MTSSRRRGHDTGSVSVELAVLAPAVLLIGLLVVAAGRISSAQQAVDDAATAAARTASLTRSASAASTAATNAATTVLGERHLRCTDTRVSVHAGGFAPPPGQTGVARVEVRCQVGLADLAGVPGLPGSTVVSSSFTSPVDPYRTSP
ncbi:TadE family protein [Prauserella oleivorans]|uniref:Uncharacterized protein n=2 Tax=Prauserella TaxID=142577 RepID=A0A2V4AVX8_9PSEU|nr:TadE family protein [Prauserella muralis]PXY25422.1 hypothetical protein BAY60_18785 [Prauserella muralis]TWE27536.1 TadE-like protein [Prauserella muralis]